MTEHSSPPPPPDTAAPLRSVHTSNLPGLLDRLGVSLLVTTYQAGRLVVLRADGGVLNTHFRIFPKPMGLAVQGDRLAVGTALEIWEYHNVPAVARKLEPAGKHDACFLPRLAHVTGDVQIHEMAWVAPPSPPTPLPRSGGEGGMNAPLAPGGRGVGGEGPSAPLAPGGRGGGGEGEAELWFVNTLFSCLAVRSATCSFQPVWRPPWVTALAPEDRCHLNGLGLRDGVPRYVTALGETDTAGGWRANKKDGGLLLDLEGNEVLLRGLSMPHSPRWYDGRLWLLESGTGSVGFLDAASRRYQPIAELPGFTRGLDFCGRLAFVGLSQVRETAVFSGIPLTERLQERTCGVWVLDVQSGETVAFLRFEDGGVQEIFAVQVLPGARFPELINDNQELLAGSFVLPDEALAAVPEGLRSPARESPGVRLAGPR
jgi:hypothetical protein